MTATIVHDIDAVARRSPDAPAMSWHHSEWSYGGLRRALRCVQRKLIDLRVQPGARVAILLRNSPQYAATYYGVMAAGCVAVPLNVQERASVLAHKVAHVTCRAVVADSEHPAWPALASAVMAEDRALVAIKLEDGADALNGFCDAMGGIEQPSLPEPPEGGLAMILYTSGTTARPKAVMLSHANLAANARAIAGYLQCSPTDKVLCVLPFHFSYGCSVLNSNLIAGAHLLLEDNFAFPHLVLRRMQDEGVTGFPGVPSTFALMLGRCRLGDYDLGRLRYITQAGGPMPSAHVEQLLANLPRTSLYIMYGQSEATARLTYVPPTKLKEKPGSVGLPLPGIELQIRKNDRVMPSEQGGEICVRGPSVMLGYWQDAESSWAVLRDGWLHTGDLGHLDADGYLYIHGRAAEMIKVGAFRVSPQEVEEVIATFPGVEEVGVVGIPDELLGQAIKAVIVMRAGSQRNALAVKAHCRKNLATYKVPKIVEFADDLPRTSSGKIKRYTLA